MYHYNPIIFKHINNYILIGKSCHLQMLRQLSNLRKDKVEKEFRESGDIVVRGSGNYSSGEQKEITRLKR